MTDVNVSKKLRTLLPKQMLRLIGLIAELARQNSCDVFLVGGIVRDILLGVENYDLDFAIEGDALQLARALAKNTGGSCIVHKMFGTATVTMPDSIKVDFATARRERYEKPASLPTVEFSTIKNDLSRRDFTINAMAIAISDLNFGQLIDFFGGQDDLLNKKIRVLHDASFIDDPTRILRAVKFEQRLNFKIESSTHRLLKEAVQMHLLEKVGRWRLNKEVALILKEKNSRKIFKRMEKLGIWPQTDLKK
ncbi:MAG: hypothetical protein NTV07_07535 [Candidatus Omnitrophica bacterium]|nr:hypothetical protein [Candidatus Omnitrophota bacterium]